MNNIPSLYNELCNILKNNKDNWIENPITDSLTREKRLCSVILFYEFILKQPQSIQQSLLQYYKSKRQLDF